ncbi:unnamed protein product, partial [Urochloa humidicola]
GTWNGIGELGLFNTRRQGGWTDGRRSATRQWHPAGEGGRARGETAAHGGGVPRRFGVLGRLEGILVREPTNKSPRPNNQRFFSNDPGDAPQLPPAARRRALQQKSTKKTSM